MGQQHQQCENLLLQAAAVYSLFLPILGPLFQAPKATAQHGTRNNSSGLPALKSGREGVFRPVTHQGQTSQLPHSPRSAPIDGSLAQTHEPRDTALRTRIFKRSGLHPQTSVFLCTCKSIPWPATCGRCAHASFAPGPSGGMA